VEPFDTAEAADVLGLNEAAVKQRLHRARAMLQEQIEGQVGAALQSAFGFLGARCDLLVESVMQRIRQSR
jgi:RNA polymerase sigma-70 factor (ECF subfamily)